MKSNYVDWNLNLANMLREKWMLFLHADLRLVTKCTKLFKIMEKIKNKDILGKVTWLIKCGQENEKNI